MIAVRIGSWDGMSYQDLTILANNNDIEVLGKSKVSGGLFSDLPYKKIKQKNIPESR